jgi:membrane protease YdiL (CAAX protease family)
MSQLSFWDHAFALIVFLGYPLYSLLTMRGEIQDIQKRGEPARLSIYREIILTWLFFAICLIAIWASLDRDWTDLGIRAIDVVPLSISIAISIVFISIFIIPLRNLARHPKRFEGLESQIGDYVELMPRSRKEESWFTGVSVNAGLSEELIFRGYLIWYLNNFVPLYWAAGIAVVVFAFAHSYQGLKQIPAILLISAVVVSLFVYSGSLLIPVLFHIVLDVLQGHYFAKIYRSQANSP